MQDGKCSKLELLHTLWIKNSLPNLWPLDVMAAPYKKPRVGAGLTAEMPLRLLCCLESAILCLISYKTSHLRKCETIFSQYKNPANFGSFYMCVDRENG